MKISHDRHHQIGQNAFLEIGRNHTLHIGKDRIEEIGNHRQDRITANHTVEIGGHAQQNIQGNYRIQVGQAVDAKSRTLLLQTGDIAQIRGPAGTITLDANGITLEAVRIIFKGPIQASSGWVKNALDMRSDPNEGKPLDLGTFPFSG